MLPTTLDQVTSYSNIECPIPMAGEDIDAGILHRSSELDARLRGHDGGDTVLLSFPRRVVTPAQAGAGAGIPDVIPVKTGIQHLPSLLDARLRGHDRRNTTLGGHDGRVKKGCAWSCVSRSACGA